MTKPEIKAEISKLKDQLKKDFCNVEKCNNKSVYYKDYEESYGSEYYAERHFICEEHKYHKKTFCGSPIGIKWTKPTLIKKGGA